MTKKQTKFFSVFWLISAVAWSIGGARHLIVSQDMVGAIIFFTAAVTSLILAFNFHKVNK